MKKFLLTCFCLVFVITLTLSFSVSVFAAEPAEEIMTAIPEEENELSRVFDLISGNSDKIFAILAFLCTLLIMLGYKKGLIPLINKGLYAMKKSADDFETKAHDSLLNTEKSLDFLTSRFVTYENTVDSVAAHLSDLSEKLESIEAQNGEREALKTVMLSQIDMLYDVFMQSGLPQYSKDALGEKVAKMKKSLVSGEEND